MTTPPACPVRIAAWVMLGALLLALVVGGAGSPCAAEEKALQPGMEGLLSDNEKRRFEAALSMVTRGDPETLTRLGRALKGDAFRRSEL